jgi:hypothetical protein
VRRPPSCRFKCADFELDADFAPALSVTQKMETPVVYIHSPFEQRVKIDVGFPQGIISQYYPNPVSFTPAIGSVSRLAGGNVSFDVTAVTGELPIPAVAAENVYAPSRNVKANFLRSSAGENEKLIFYRGLGDFQNSLRVTSTGGAIKLRNLGAERVPNAFLVHVDRAGGVALRALGGVAAAGDLEVAAADIESLISGSRSTTDSAGGFLTKALQATGLYADEAQSMVDTWKRSYFKTAGLRVLYVLPQEETERVLPMRVSPAPSELVRTLVGRIELLRESEEQAFLARIVKEGRSFPAVAEFGRFAEPQLRRLRQIAPLEAIAALDAMIDQVK